MKPEVLEAIAAGWLVDAGWSSRNQGYFGGKTRADVSFSDLPDDAVPVWYWWSTDDDKQACVLARSLNDDLPLDVPPLVFRWLEDRKARAWNWLHGRSKYWTR